MQAKFQWKGTGRAANPVQCFCHLSKHLTKWVPGIILQPIGLRCPCPIGAAQLYPHLHIYWPIRGHHNNQSEQWGQANQGSDIWTIQTVQAESFSFAYKQTNQGLGAETSLCTSQAPVVSLEQHFQLLFPDLSCNTSVVTVDCFTWAVLLK